MIRWKYIVYTIASLLVIMGIVGIRRYNRNKELTRQRSRKESGLVAVTLASVESHVFHESVPFTGTLLAINRAELKAEETGRVTRVMVREGDRVSAGSILSSQSEDDLSIAVQVAEAHLTIAKAQAQQVGSDNARAQSLLANGNVTHQYAQQSETKYIEAMALLHARESSLSLAKSHLRKSRIVAPFNGEVSQRFIQPGEMLVPGQIAFAMVDNRKLEIQADLPADNIAKLKTGMKVSFRVSGFDRVFAAILTQIGSSIQHDGRTLRVRMEVVDNTGCLKSGLFAEGEIVSDREVLHPALPSEILATVDGNADIYVVDQGVACRRKVFVGGDENGWRPVHGVDVGANVVAQGRNLVIDGTPVSIVGDVTSKMGK